MKLNTMSIFAKEFDLKYCLEQVYQHGYFFSNESSEEFISLLLKEAKAVPQQFADHVNNPININKTYKVTQSHERYYRMLGDDSVPVANSLCQKLGEEVGKLDELFPELKQWNPTEIGYQKYRDGRDFISPHRDRWSDKKLSVTLTLSGAAFVKIYKPLTEPIDYKFIEQIDEFEAKAGTLMFLRANGFGNGIQIIHEVMSPHVYPRYILNLRTRETLLPFIKTDL